MYFASSPAPAATVKACNPVKSWSCGWHEPTTHAAHLAATVGSPAIAVGAVLVILFLILKGVGKRAGSGSPAGVSR